MVMLPFSVTLNDLGVRVPGYAIIWCWISQKLYKIGTHNGKLTVTYT